jgi:L-alanine-DL-glutamate epimerase-like enolase superfamily enzyme
VKIKNLIVKPLSWDLDPPLSNPVITWDKKEIVLVFIETDTGLTGVGEGWVAGATARALVATLEDDITPVITGRDPLQISAIWEDLNISRSISARPGIIRAAMSAVDMALWDILGKHAGLPLYQLLGGQSDLAFVYASAGLYGKSKTTADLANEMSGYIAKGFTAVKMKVGGPSPTEDVERVKAVREAIGPDHLLMVDAVCGMKTHEALALAERIKPYDIYFFEQPVAAYDYEGMAVVNTRSGIPVAGNENFFDLHEFNELLLRKSVTFTQFDLAMVGGISEGLRIDAAARAWYSPTTIHSAGSIVCMAASLHLAAALPNCESLEYHMLHSWLFETVPEDFLAVKNSHVRLLDKPGLGLDLDPEHF